MGLLVAVNNLPALNPREAILGPGRPAPAGSIMEAMSTIKEFLFSSFYTQRQLFMRIYRCLLFCHSEPPEAAKNPSLRSGQVQTLVS